MALATLAVLKTHLGIASTDTSQDDRLTQFLSQADALIKSELGRDIESASYTEYYSGDGSQVLVLRNRPVTAITAIYQDSTGYFGDGTGAFASTTELVEGRDFVLKRDRQTESHSGIVYRIGTVWPEPSVSMRHLLAKTGGYAMGNIKVTYTGGYSSVPADLQFACCQVVASMRRTASQGTELQSETLDYYSYSLASMDRSTATDVKNVLKNYKRIVF